MPTYNKLVRDRVPEIIAAEGKSVRTRTLDEVEFRRALVRKLIEETNELDTECQMGNEKGIIKEASDVLEVFEALMAAYGVRLDDVLRVKALRKEGRGGFSGRIFLESADD